ncbi:MAG: hypothetical protein AAF456_19220 [Planctomycetota bacterium]
MRRPFLAFAFLLVFCSTTFGQFSLNQTLLPELFVAQQSNVGESVAITADRIVVGFPGADLFGGISTGAVQIYDTAGTHELTLLYPVATPVTAAFGDAVAIDGDILVVGAPADSTIANQAGAVYVYDLSGSQPDVPIHTLFSSAPAASKRFGQTVDVSNGKIVVGSPGIAGFTPEGPVDAFDLDSPMPTVPVQTWVNPGSSTNQFGKSVAIDGEIVAISAPRGIGQPVRIYDLAAPNPLTPVKAIPNPTEAASNEFGFDIAMDGDMLVVGDPSDFFFPSTVAGSVYVFDLSVAHNLPLHSLTSPDWPLETTYGNSVAISGDLFLVGEPDIDLNGNPATGRAFLYDLNSTNISTPSHVFEHPNQTNNQGMGSDVGISGNLAVIGAPGNGGSGLFYDISTLPPMTPLSLSEDLPGKTGFGADIDSTDQWFVSGMIFDPTQGVESGSIQINSLDDPGFVPQIIRPTDGSAGNEFGAAVSVEGDLVAVGAKFAQSGAGQVYLYDLGDPDPAMTEAILTAPDAEAGDFFGAAVSQDDNRLAVGIPLDGEQNFGAVSIHDLSSSSPEGTPLVIESPDQTVNWEFGRSVAIWRNIVAVGAKGPGSSFSPRGHLYVFDTDSPATPLLSLPSPDPNFLRGFGGSVAVDQSIVVVGCDRIAGNIAVTPGVYIYDLNSATPSVPIVEILDPDPQSQSRFGISVDIRDSIVMVGSVFNSTPDFGRAYLFDLNSANPEVPFQTIDHPDGQQRSNLGSSVSISRNFAIVGADGNDSPGTDVGAVFVYRNSVTQLTPDSIQVTKGILRNGDAADVEDSDNNKLAAGRSNQQVFAVVEVEAKSICPVSMPTSFSFSVEASVFARTAISREIELFDYNNQQWELVETGAASRFGDTVTTVTPGGDLSRFVEPGTGCVEARIRYESSVNRTRFTANIDQIKWTVE